MNGIMASIPVRYESIPACMKELPQWIIWRYDTREDGTPYKCLYQPKRTHKKAASTRPEEWATFLEAAAVYERGGWEGIGFVFKKGGGFTGIDLDNCRNPETKQWAPWAREIIKKFDSYTELSPSGTGAKIYVLGTSPFETGKNKKLENIQGMLGDDSEKKPGIEMYSFERYFAVTGWRLAGCKETVEFRQDAINWIADEYIRESYSVPTVKTEDWNRTPLSERASRYLATLPQAISGSNGSKPTFRAACVLVLGFALSVNEAYPILKAWSDATSVPPWSESELMHKLNSANAKNDLRGYLRNSTPQEWRNIRIPDYEETSASAVSIGDIKRTSLDDAAYAYLDGFVKGDAKTFDLGIPDLDYAIGGGVEAGEMIMFAARPNHGKSMIAQQIIYTFRRAGIPCAFISEEMGPKKLGKRLIHTASPIPRETWKYQEDRVKEDIKQFIDGMAPCYVVENCRTAKRVSAEIDSLVKDGVGFIVVDYAQRLTSGDRRANGYEDLKQVSMSLKDSLNRNQIPGVVLAQMGRGIETRPKFIPLMSDLKECGQFEQDADVIVFQVWPHRINPENDPSEYKLYIAKNKDREINQPVINCRFVPSRQMLVHSRDSAHPDLAFDAAEAFPQKYGFSPDPML